MKEEVIYKDCLSPGDEASEHSDQIIQKILEQESSDNNL